MKLNMTIQKSTFYRIFCSLIEDFLFDVDFEFLCPIDLDINLMFGFVLSLFFWGVCVCASIQVLFRLITDIEY